jgi:hypothetical protein
VPNVRPAGSGYRRRAKRFSHTERFSSDTDTLEKLNCATVPLFLPNPHSSHWRAEKTRGCVCNGAHSEPEVSDIECVVIFSYRGASKS